MDDMFTWNHSRTAAAVTGFFDTHRTAFPEMKEKKCDDQP
jgi:hypothetical protein